MSRQLTLKPQDVAVILQLTLTPDASYAELAESVSLSVSETHAAVARLIAARLVGRTDKTPSVTLLAAFIEHGVPYAFPGGIGAEAPGIPTAHSAPFLGRHIHSEQRLVWPSARGETRGLSVTPLYSGAIETPNSSPPLYKMLTLVDAVRVGRARERRLALDMLTVLFASPARQRHVRKKS